MIEVNLTPDADLRIEKDLSIEEAERLSQRRFFPRITVKYSGVPDLLYHLAKEVGVPEEKDFPEVEGRISLSGELLEDFLRRVEADTGFKSRLWKLLDEYPNEIFIEDLKRLKRQFPDAEYVGFVPGSAEYGPVDILKVGSIIYLVQNDILPLNREETKEVVGKIINYYGATVSPVLRLVP